MNKTLIELAAQDAIEAFAPQVEQLLEALGFPGSLVTDESQVWDFLLHFGSAQEKEEANTQTLASLSALVGRPATAHELLWELARELATRQAEALPRTIN